MANARRIAAARAMLERVFGRGLRHSRVWRTPAWPVGSGPDFANAVTILPRFVRPEDLLKRLHRIEAAAGRKRHKRWAMRTLDLDLLAVGALVRPDRDTVRVWTQMPVADQARQAPDRLILPHPRVQDRVFVLAPLCDLAPDWRHPITGLTARRMLAALPASAHDGVRPMAL